MIKYMNAIEQNKKHGMKCLCPMNQNSRVVGTHGFLEDLGKTLTTAATTAVQNITAKQVAKLAPKPTNNSTASVSNPVKAPAPKPVVKPVAKVPAAPVKKDNTMIYLAVAGVAAAFLLTRNH